jgi:PAS domain S-box-containing protein
VTWEQDNAPGDSLTQRRGWAFAAVCVALALVARWLLDPLWVDRLPFATFFLAVVVVTHFTDMGPSVFAIITGLLLGIWFFAAPRHSFIVSNPVDRINVGFYFAVCFIVLFYTRRSRQSQERERTARRALARLAAIIESSDDAIIGRSLDGKIRSWNAGATNLYGFTEAEAAGQPVTFPKGPEEPDNLMSLLDRVSRGQHIKHLETTRRRKDGEWVDVSLCVSPVRNGAGQIIGVSTIARDIAERKRAERERERLVEELQRLLGEVKTLTGLLPICAYCKKIRDDTGYWNKLEDYIGRHSTANFTHSVCPDCANHHYADFIRDMSPGQ